MAQSSDDEVEELLQPSTTTQRVLDAVNSTMTRFDSGRYYETYHGHRVLYLQHLLRNLRRHHGWFLHNYLNLDSYYLGSQEYLHNNTMASCWKFFNHTGQTLPAYFWLAILRSITRYTVFVVSSSQSHMIHASHLCAALAVSEWHATPLDLKPWLWNIYWRCAPWLRDHADASPVLARIANLSIAIYLFVCLHKL